jgi:hypothetical protein
MRQFSTWASVCLIGLVSLTRANAASADDNDGPSKDAGAVAASILASVPAAELPAKAAELVALAKAHDQEAVALAAVRFAAASRPGSLTPVVASVTRSLPTSASAVAATAAKLVPSEGANISQAALQAAPGQAAQINRALGKDDKAKDPGAPGPVLDRGNRPTIPPGWLNVSKPGAIRGNRPEIPPGLVRDPKPGRDPQRRNYGSP